MFLFSSTLFMASVLAAPAPLVTVQSDLAELTTQTNQAFGLEQSQVQVLPLVRDAGQIRTIVHVESQPLLLELEPYSVFAPDFVLYEQIADGSVRKAEFSQPNTLRGELIGAPGSVVAGSLEEDGLYARIFLADGQEYWIEPVARLVPGALREQHVLYAAKDVLETHHTCSVAGVLSLDYQSATAGIQYGVAGPSVAELACDADFEYYQDYGSSTANVQNRIGSVINTMNLQYEAEVGITHSITSIIVRTTSNDPYSSTDAVTLLNQFRDHWNSNQGGIQRDVAHLFTGKEVNSSTIGIAWVGAVCSSFAYGLVQSDFNNNFSCATDLSAHELGHNWGAGHCNCNSFTMNPSITCANTFSPTQSIPEIVAFRDSLDCLDGGAPPVDATSVHVNSIAAGQQSIGQGNKLGTATIQVVDDQGNPVSNAVVSVTFSGGGSLNGPASGTTSSSGTVTILSPGSKKGKIRFTVCVDNISASLAYAPGDNVETCEVK